MSIILDGKLTAKNIRKELRETIKTLDFAPVLAVILVGNDPASQVYVRSKEKSAAKVGIETKDFRLPETTTFQEILDLIHKLNNDPEVDGILLQLPLPKGLDERKLLDEIAPEKDVDGFHPVNQGRLLLGDTSGLVPCTPAGVMEILKRYDVNPEGKKCVIIGRSNIVGKPMAALMIKANATVTVCHSRTRNLDKEVAAADILVVAAGKRNVIKSEWVKEGTVVVDVGIHRLEDGSLAGDVEFDELKDKASHITPVPGGIGPMTISLLLVNTLKASLLRRKGNLDKFPF